jgi:hypothetical protein
MKKNYLLGLLTILITVFFFQSLNAQTPNQFKYQAVLRDAGGNIITSQQKSVVIDILQGSASGTSVFTETHNVTTTAQGIINLNIGSVNTTGIAAIDWSGNTYFIKITVGGVQMGTSQLLSVPYALYASKAGNGFSGNYSDLANKPSLFSGNYNDLTNKPNLAKVATSGSFTDLLNVPRLVTLSKNPSGGDILYHNGADWELLPKGTNGQTLRLDNGIPKWAEPGYALPIVTTLPATDIMTTAATSGGTVVSPGYTEITAKGVCWATTQNPTTANDKTSEGTGPGSFSSALKTLQPNTTYYARAFATNGAGTAYGNQVWFKTFQNVVFPTVTTAAITNITANAVTSGGNVTATGGSEVTAHGVCWSDHQNPVITDNKTTDGNGTGQFQSQIAGLIPGTFYARAYATNSAGTGYGNMVTFTTEKTLPVLTTKAITEISAMGAVSGGNISTAGGGTITGRGICWSDSPNPTIANEKTTSTATASSFSAAIAKATPGTTYYLKAYATNEIGTGYGDQKTFTTSDAQYYTSFETGMTPAGWSGQFKVSNESSLNGSYSFESLDSKDSDAILTLTLTTSAQISFFYSFSGGTDLTLYIDDKVANTYNYDGTSWRQAAVDVSSGLHIIKWHFHSSCYNCGNYNVYIDQIIITK